MTGYYPFQLLREWRDARQAIFDADFGRIPLPDHKPYWDRLAKAEHALMDLARGLEPYGITLTSDPRSQS